MDTTDVLTAMSVISEGDRIFYAGVGSGVVWFVQVVSPFRVTLGVIEDETGIERLWSVPPHQAEIAKVDDTWIVEILDAPRPEGWE